MGQSRMQAAYDRAFRSDSFELASLRDCRINSFFCWSVKAFTNASIASNRLDLARSLPLAGGCHLLADYNAGCIEHNLKRTRLIPVQGGEKIFRLQMQVC